MTLCLLIFALMIVLFFIKKIPMSFSSMLVVVLLVVTGCVESKTALGSFGNSTVVTMASMFIVAAGLTRTQMINRISQLLYKVTDGSFTKVLATYMVITCILGHCGPVRAGISAGAEYVRPHEYQPLQNDVPHCSRLCFHLLYH